MMYYEKRDSYQEGIMEGIKCVINAYKSLNATGEQAKTTLIEQFHLTEEKAD